MSIPRVLRLRGYEGPRPSRQARQNEQADSGADDQVGVGPAGEEKDQAGDQYADRPRASATTSRNAPFGETYLRSLLGRRDQVDDESDQCDQQQRNFRVFLADRRIAGPLRRSHRRLPRKAGRRWPGAENFKAVEAMGLGRVALALGELDRRESRCPSPATSVSMCPASLSRARRSDQDAGDRFDEHVSAVQGERIEQRAFVFAACRYCGAVRMVAALLLPAERR